MCLAGDWRLRRGSAVQSNHANNLRCHVAPLNSRETLFSTVIERLAVRLLWSGSTEETCRGLFT